MKNVLNFLLVLSLLILFSNCAKEIATPTQSKIVKVGIEDGYRLDTIITFDADTYEETIEIVKTKVVSTTQQKRKTIDQENKLKLATDEVYRIDTVITFNPDTYEETIQIIKTKIEGKSKKN